MSVNSRGQARHCRDRLHGDQRHRTPSRARSATVSGHDFGRDRLYRSHQRANREIRADALREPRADQTRIDQNAAINLAKAIPTSERERAVDLAPVKLERPENTLFTGASDAPEMRAADQHHAGSERQRLDDVNSATKAAIDQHRDRAAERIDDRRQRGDRTDGAVELAPAMVGYDNGVEVRASELRAPRRGEGGP